MDAGADPRACVIPPQYRDQMPSLPTLELIRKQVEAQLDIQLRHMESLDNKAGVALGFSGILAATAEPEGALDALARVTAALAALAAMSSLIPRDFPILKMRAFRDRYLQANQRFISIHLLDTKIRMEEEASMLLSRKAGRLKVALVLLVASVLLSTSDTFVTGGN